MIRRLFPSERASIAAHLKRLSPADRQMRFEIITTDAFIDAYVRNIKFSQDVVYGAFDDHLVLRGVAHVGFIKGIAEVGLSVESACRGAGIGSKMLDRAIRIARLRRAKTFTSMCLTNNRWMMKAMRERGFAIEREYNTAIATTDLAPPDIMAIGGEIAAEHMAWNEYTRTFWFGWLRP